MSTATQQYLFALLFFICMNQTLNLEDKVSETVTRDIQNAATNSANASNQQSDIVENLLDELAYQLNVENRTILRITSSVRTKTQAFQQPTAKRSITKDVFEKVAKQRLVEDNKTIAEEGKASTLDCKQFRQLGKDQIEGDPTSFCYSPSDSLTCYQDPIFCKVFHMSGKRELEWPVYGEYSYLSHKNWVKILQHGGIVFLYHPCANKSVVDKLRSVAESCLHRFVLTPYDKLTYQRPLGMVSWGCYLLMKDVNMTKSKEWIKSHAYKAPASHIHKNGTYETKLLKASKVLTDTKDSVICPDEHQKAIFQATIAPEIKTNQLHNSYVGEDLILKRLAKVKHMKRTHKKISRNLTVNSKKAVSAFFSLVFLCVLLSILLLYTRLWRPGEKGNKCLYKRLIDNPDGYDVNPGYNELGLLKSSQNFINRFRKKKKDRTLDSLSKVKLLDTINEEDDEYEGHL